MKRIAIIRSASSAVSKSQYNIQEVGLAKELAKQGMFVDVFLISDKEETYFETLGVEGRVTLYWLKGYKIPGQQGYYPDLTNILKKNKYDLIQALDDSQLTTVLVSRYCKKKKIKFILWQGMYENYPETYKRLIQYIFDWTLLKILRKNTQYCIAKTTSAKAYLESKHFRNIDVIPVALELENFLHSDSIDYRKILNIPNNQKILLYIGKVEERRKPFFCMDVYSKIKEEHDDCCLVYVGKGPLLEETCRYVTEKGIRDVHFVDSIPQNELADLYAISSMFILPTRYEIFGMVLMESMYFGTPVITYKAAGPIDVITDGVDGIVMNEFVDEQWAEKACEHIYEKDDCYSMGELSRKKIQKEYVWSSVAKHYYKKYMSIICD